MGRRYVNKRGKPYYGAAADAHHTKELGFGSAEAYADSAFNDGYDEGYKAARTESRKRWKADKEAESRRKKIKVS